MPSTERSSLPDGFRANDPLMVRQVIARLLGETPSSPITAAAWFELFCDTSDAITGYQTDLEIRAAQDLKDRSVQLEIEQFEDQVVGLLLNHRAALIRTYITSPWRQSMHADDGGRLVADLTKRLRASDTQLTHLQLKENALIRSYRSFAHNARTQFMERDVLLSIVVGRMNDRTEAMRRMAYKSYWSFVSDNRTSYSTFFEELATLRLEQAKATGAANYETFIYDDMGRSFTPADAMALREHIARHIVPVVTKLAKKQALSFEPLVQGHRNKDATIAPWNTRFWQTLYPEQHPCEGSQDKLIHAVAAAMTNMHPAFKQCFEDVRATGGLDIFPRQHKAPGAFCALRPVARVPFVFGNFAVSTRDLFTLFHELGHAVHGYCSAPIKNALLRNPGLEYCEFVSTTFEFLVHNSLQYFWPDKQQAKLAAGFHLFHSVAFLPFVAQLDEWQSLAYRMDGSPDDLWAKLSDKYRPQIDWRSAQDALGEGIKGLGWCSRPHVFTTPFYYIDYAIAQIGAWQIYGQMQHGEAERERTLERFLSTLFLGGQRSCLELFEAAGCESPFAESTVIKVARLIETTFTNLEPH